MAETDIKVDVEIPDLSTLPDAAPSDPLEALSWLGGSIEEVAEGLRARGIKGKLHVAASCPLANYLRTWFPNPSVFMNVSCMSDDISYYFLGDTPDPCVGFINRFDSRYFPDLIDNG